MNERQLLQTPLSNGEEVKPSTREDALCTIAADREAHVRLQETRKSLCGEELAVILEKYGCVLQVQQLWIDGVPQQARIVLLAKD